MSWINITQLSQLEEIKTASFTKPQLIFKHSTTCSISRMSLARMERNPFPLSIDFYYLDLLNYRSISTAIADEFVVFHESPQIILIKNGACIYDESHGGIQMEEIITQAGIEV